jgi:hypothetical protein
MSRRVMRARVEAAVVLVRAEEDTVCSLVLTLPADRDCRTIIFEGEPYVAMIDVSRTVMHRYCVPCSRNLFGWPE